MAELTKIEWTDSTWNPWMGCHKVSQGCKNCYMFREQIQYGNDPNIVRRSKTKFTDPLKWKEPRKIFTCSWSDWFIEEADPWRAEAWDIIRHTPQHTYQILTKRPERIDACLPAFDLPNVWLGVSAEDQESAAKRVKHLFGTPFPVRFVSYEPALGPLDLGISIGSYVDWVIMGCESGPHARPMDLDWARSMRDQCQPAGVSFFLKQAMVDGKLTKLPLLDGKQWAEYPRRKVMNEYIDKCGPEAQNSDSDYASWDSDAGLW
jgi:protein gp37